MKNYSVVRNPNVIFLFLIKKVINAQSCSHQSKIIVKNNFSHFQIYVGNLCYTKNVFGCVGFSAGEKKKKD